MSYTKLFDPDTRVQHATGAEISLGDRADVDYVYPAKAVLAINLALATQRPLLVSGPSGCGKTSLAEDVAQVLDWEFLLQTVHSRMEAYDLLYEIDYVRRFQDAQPGAGGLKEMQHYINPGLLWRAFDPDGAKQCRASSPAYPSATAHRTGKPEPREGVVALLDEIDKADPDVPNNLLLPLGSYEFHIDELNAKVYAQRRVLLILTTNNERRLPDAFLRRCVDLPLSEPNREALIEIGKRHLSPRVDAYLRNAPEPPNGIYDAVADLVEKAAADSGQPVSTAEYLDTLRAVLNLNVHYGSPDWNDLPNYTVRKSGRSGGIL
jgi:MoxR-like ATPase